MYVCAEHTNKLVNNIAKVKLNEGKNIVKKKIHECMHTHGGKNVHKTIYSGLKSKLKKFSATSY